MSSNESRALELLGAGVPAESVASAIGVTPSYISQLLSDENFASQVTELRFTAVSAHNKRDNKYDALEDSLLDKLESTKALILRPRDILGALKVLNSATRRGSSSGNNIVNQQTIVNLVMPTAVVQKFTTNIQNQVVATGEQSLVTIQSGELLKQTEDKTKLITNQLTNPIPDTVETEEEYIEPINEVLAAL